MHVKGNYKKQFEEHALNITKPKNKYGRSSNIQLFLIKNIF